mgnify:CR=1 FL=1
MKTFAELTPEKQVKAVEKAVEYLLRGICEGAIRFNDTLNGDGLQSRIDCALEKAERMQTPWFAGGYIMDTCREDIEAMARADAEDSIYPEPGECCVAGIA